MDVFISYCSARRELTRHLESRLNAEGFDSIWWDRDLSPADQFGSQIDRQIEAAKAIIVIWTPEAVRSAYVLAEARHALRRGVLVSVKTPEVLYSSIPKPFGEMHIVDISQTDKIILGLTDVWRGKPENVNLVQQYFLSTKRHLLSTKIKLQPAVGHFTPSMLLDARHALAEFSDVHGLRRDLVDWSQEASLSGRLLYGPGGSGKTRLMTEVCDDLKAQGFSAGFLDRAPDGYEREHRRALEDLVLARNDSGLMIVLDYAEHRQAETERLADLLFASAQERPDRPIRLVLLARAGGEWWERAMRESYSLQRLFGRNVALKLPSFEAIEDRRRLFTDAVQVFQPLMSPVSKSNPDSRLSEEAFLQPAYASPLMIQISALLHLQDFQSANVGPAQLLDGILGLEERYWRTSLGSAADPKRLEAVGRGVAQTTLVGGASNSDLETLLIGDNYYSRRSPADVAEPLSDIGRFYGTAEGHVLAVEPDLVGEHLAAARADERVLGACLDWAERSKAGVGSVLVVLNRATRPEHGAKAEKAERLLKRVIETRGATLARDIVAAALEAPGRLPELIEEMAPHMDEGAVQAFVGALPGTTYRLGDAAVALLTRATLLQSAALALDRENVQLQIATGRMHSALGARLAMRKRPHEALTHARNAVDLFRGAKQKDADATLGLARSLSSLGLILADVGKPDVGVAAVEEACLLLRAVDGPGDDRIVSELADATNNLSRLLALNGRLDEALAAIRETVGLRREQFALYPRHFESSLASSLNNLGRRLFDLQKYEEALSVANEAVALFQGLAEQAPDSYSGHLATSLNNLGNILSALERHEDAISPARQALDIRRRICAANPGSPVIDLAFGLHNLGRALSNLKQFKEAAEVAQEAVDIRRMLVGQSARWKLDLATSLVSLGSAQHRLGLNETAFETMHEGIAIQRSLLSTGDANGAFQLASSLKHLARAHFQLRNVAEAMSAISDARNTIEPFRNSRESAFRQASGSIDLLLAHYEEGAADPSTSD